MKRILTTCMLLGVLLSVYGQKASCEKLSPWLRQVWTEQGKEKSVRQNVARRAGENADQPEEPEQQIVTFVQFNREVKDEELTAFQCRRYAQLDDIAIVMLPLSKLPEFSEHISVQRVEANQRAQTTMDTVPQSINLLPVYEATAQHSAYTGKGVVVGVMDVGFDLTHPNFYQDKALKNYRIGAFWDQLAPHDDDSELPVGRSYTTQEDILTKGCSSDSPTENHGTHTLGIAAGSGYDTSYRGVAYESEICLVSNAVSSDSIYLDKEYYYRYTSATDALGFKYIFDYAKKQQKPCVISFSEGYAPYIDQDDSLYAAFIGKMTGPGRIFVASAGNENVEMTYAEKPQGTEAAGAFVRAFKEKVFYRFKTDGKLDIHLPIYDKVSGELLQTHILSMAGAAMDSVRSDTVYVGDQPLSINLMRWASVAELGDTIYYMTMHAPVSFDQFANVGLVMVGKDSRATLYGTSTSALRNHGDLDNRCTTATYGHNVFAPGCFSTAICVGATMHRSQVTNIEGVPIKAGGTAMKGQLDYYSSTGPALNGLEKPNITAPGTLVVSSSNSFYHETNPADTKMMISSSSSAGRSYPWVVNTGTSMATPVVAGTIALWLEACPSLTRNDIMDVLSKTSRQPDESLTYPNNQYGYGEIDAYRGLLDVLGLTAIKTISTEQSDVQVSVRGKELLLNFAETLRSSVIVSLYSVSGQLCSRVEIAAGQQEYRMPLTMVASGIYAVQLNGRDAGVTGSQLIRL